MLNLGFLNVKEALHIWAHASKWECLNQNEDSLLSTKTYVVETKKTSNWGDSFEHTKFMNRLKNTSQAISSQNIW